MSDRILCTIENGVADVRMNRPDKMNALDGALFGALVETGEALKADPSVRAVVLSGEGRAFCAGLDMAVFPKRRYQHGAIDKSKLRARVPEKEIELRREFLSLYQ